MKFILTKELGRLAKWLRILGYDSIYFKQDNPSSLIIQSLRDGRIIITRNSRLSKPLGIKSVLIEAETIKEQMSEVLEKLNLKPDANLMFTRCTICNIELADIDKEKIKDKVPEYVFNTQEDFVICPSCNRIYWLGTHWGNVQTTLKEITTNPKSQ
jgi:uncharacterized protein with PIN domain